MNVESIINEIIKNTRCTFKNIEATVKYYTNKDDRDIIVVKFLVKIPGIGVKTFEEVAEYNSELHILLHTVIYRKIYQYLKMIKYVEQTK